MKDKPALTAWFGKVNVQLMACLCAFPVYSTSYFLDTTAGITYDSAGFVIDNINPLLQDPVCCRGPSDLSSPAAPQSGAASRLAPPPPQARQRIGARGAQTIRPPTGRV